MCFLGCSKTVFDDGFIKINIPSGWGVGQINTSKSYVFASTVPKTFGETLQSLINPMESNLEDPSFSFFEEGIIVSGKPKETLADARFILGDIIISKRDVDIEAKRIGMINSTIQPDQIYNNAEINVIQNAYFMLGAKTSDVVISDTDVLAEMERSFDEVVSAGGSKEGFLTGWGITENEFRKLISEKLVYAEMIEMVDNTFPDLNEAESASEFLVKMSEIYELKEVTSQAISLSSTVIERDNGFLIISGVLYDEKDENNLNRLTKELLNSFESISPSSVYIFSSEG